MKGLQRRGNVMDKPHWRCERCDGGRYHIWKDKSISCTKCGFFQIPITSTMDCENK